MPKFEELSRPGKCNVCEKEADVAVFASSMGPISYAYCKECAENGLEPYGGMVAYLSSTNYPDKVNPYYVEKVRYILEKLGKTEEEFVSDCKKARDDYVAFLQGVEEDTFLQRTEEEDKNAE